MTVYEGTYKCKWPGPNGNICGNKFIAVFKVIETVKGNPTVRGTHGGCSSVKCPVCQHNLKPKTDAISLKEI